MKPVFIRPATVEDALDVAGRLRQEEVEAIHAASGGRTPEMILPAYVAARFSVWAAGVNDRPEALFGLCPIEDSMDIAIAWSVNTPTIYDFPVEFAVTSRQVWDTMHSMYPVLTNFVDARNERLLKWLRWLGAVILPQRVSMGGIPFVTYMSHRH